MLASPDAYNLIRQFEGCRLTAYPDPGTGGSPWTIGYGSTHGAVKGMTITQADAESRLRLDVSRCEVAISQLVNRPLEQCQYDALASLIFNIGAANLKTSTLLKQLNHGRDIEAAAEFPKWCHAAGRTLPGLLARREAEQALFLQGVKHDA